MIASLRPPVSAETIGCIALFRRRFVFVERYNRLHEITQTVIQELVPNGVEVLFRFILAGGGPSRVNASALSSMPLSLGLDRVTALLPETASPHDRDHLVLVHLAAIESHLYRHDYYPTGHMIRIMAGNYGVAPEEEKQSIIRNGFPCVVGTVSSPEEMIALTPLKRVTDAEYSDLYEKLVAAWGKPRQKEAAAMMKARLTTIHDFLPRHKIGDDFRRVRAGREEPLPLYVRNEIHHPTTDGLRKSKRFQQDKRIGYAIMEAWLFKND